MIVLLFSALAGPPSSMEAARSLEAGEPLTARRLATEALEKDEDDYVAHTVLAEVFWTEDGNLPRGMYHYRKAASIYANRGANSFPQEVRNWNCRRLKQQAWLHEEMENARGFYTLVEEYNAGCQPKMEAEIAWRLMKDERLEEARAVVATGLASEDSIQQITAGNVQCALDAKLRSRDDALRSCIESAELTKRLGFRDTVDAYNAGWAAIQAADHDEAMRWLKHAAANPSGDRTNPWTSLASLHLLQGNGPEALAAIRRMQQWRHAQEPTDRAQNRADADATLAEFLLAIGRADDARVVIDRAISRPDRRASTTSSAGMTEAAHRMMRIRIRRVQRERKWERAATQWWWIRAGHGLANLLPDPEDTEDRLRVAGLMTDGNLFEQTFALLNDHGVPLSPWLIGDFVDVLGPGLVQASLDAEREREPLPIIHAYYDALETEVAWHRGRSDLPEVAQRALDTLPKTEVLLKARVQARLADHLWRSGRVELARSAYTEAFDNDPGVFRRLELPLPTRFQSDGSPDGDAIATQLGRSPRFRSASGGFTVSTTATSICLSNPSAREVHCSRATSTDTNTFIETFHQQAFSIPIGSSSRLDMNSLDGTTQMRRQDQRDRVDRLMKGYEP